MAFDNYDDIKVGDVIECFDVRGKSSRPSRVPGLSDN